MESNEKARNTQVINEEINYSELIDIGRKFANTEDKKSAETNLNLALLAPNIDTFGKIQAVAIKSFIYYKDKNIQVILCFVKKALKILDNTKLNNLETTAAFCLIRILYRGGMLLSEMNEPYMASYLFFTARNIFEEKNLTRIESESYETLETAFTSVLKEISADVIFY
jgi:hypothetical protein